MSKTITRCDVCGWYGGGHSQGCRNEQAHSDLAPMLPEAAELPKPADEMTTEQLATTFYFSPSVELSPSAVAQQIRDAVAAGQWSRNLVGPETAKAPGAKYPDSNPKTAFGMKKPGISAVPPIAIMHLGLAMAEGRRKYGQMNWRDDRVTSSVYTDAMWRHLDSWRDGQELDEGSEAAPGSGLHHLAHVMACCAILLDAQAYGTLNDDRTLGGPLAAAIVARTLPITVKESA